MLQYKICYHHHNKYLILSEFKTFYIVSITTYYTHRSWLYTNGTLESITDNEMIFSNGNGSSPRIAQLSVNIESTTSTTSSSVSSSFSTKIFPTSFSTEIFTSSTSVQMYSSSTASTYSSTTASTYSSSTPASTYSSSTPASTYSSSTPASTYITTIITTVFPTSTPDSIIGCQSKDGWPYTKAGQNATGTFCFDGTVNGYIILLKYCTCNNF